MANNEKRKAEKPVKVNAKNGLNLRDSPGGTILTTLANNTKVEVKETAGNWAKVSVNGVLGWAMREYLREA